MTTAPHRSTAAPHRTAPHRRRPSPLVVLVATTAALLVPAVPAGAASFSAAVARPASTVELSTTYQCTDDVNTAPGYVVTVDQTTTTPDAAPAGGQVAVQVTALQLTFDEGGSTALRAGGATGLSGLSSTYQFGYGDEQTGVLTMDGGMTLGEQPLGTEGAVRVGATATGGSTTMPDTPLRLYAPSFFDLSLTPTGGGGPLEVTCSTNLDTLLATVASGPAESSASSTSRLVVSVVALVVVAAGVAALLRWRRRRSATVTEDRDPADMN